MGILFKMPYFFKEAWMKLTDSSQIIKRIENKLMHSLGTTVSEATNDEIYKAAAECIREDIMTVWAESRKRVQALLYVSRIFDGQGVFK